MKQFLIFFIKSQHIAEESRLICPFFIFTILWVAMQGRGGFFFFRDPGFSASLGRGGGSIRQVCRQRSLRCSCGVCSDSISFSLTFFSAFPDNDYVVKMLCIAFILHSVKIKHSERLKLIFVFFLFCFFLLHKVTKAQRECLKPFAKEVFPSYHAFSVEIGRGKKK